MLTLEHWPIGKLIEYARNPRKNDKAVDRVAAAIKEFGFRVPVIAKSDGLVVDGHLRLKAAKKLGMAEVPVVLADDLTDAQIKALRLSVNKMSELAEWDFDLLKLELEDLNEMGFDLEFTGFDSAELDRLLSDAADLESAEVTPDVPETPLSIQGDMWCLGQHRLLCGDSTVATDVKRVMGGQVADFVFTSPPYAQQRKYGAKDGIEDWDALMQGVFSLLPTKQGAQVLVNLGLVHKDQEWQPYWSAWIDWMRAAEWRSFGWYIWDQGHGLPGDWNGRLAPSHEFIFHFNRAALKANKTKEKRPENVKFNNHGSGLRQADGTMSGVSNRAASMQTHKIPDSVIRVMRHKARGIEVSHPAVFPVALAKELSDAYTKEDDRVYEPFSGSGSSIMAAELTHRICHAIEIHPPYTDVAVMRWQQHTGKQAIHEETGKTFEEMKDVRFNPAKNSAESYSVGIAAIREEKQKKRKQA